MRQLMASIYALEFADGYNNRVLVPFEPFMTQFTYEISVSHLGGHSRILGSFLFGEESFLLV